MASPLRRRFKYLFCSLETSKAVFKIFVNAFNNFALHKFLPCAKSLIASWEYILNMGEYIALLLNLDLSVGTPI